MVVSRFEKPAPGISKGSLPRLQGVQFIYLQFEIRRSSLLEVGTDCLRSLKRQAVMRKAVDWVAGCDESITQRSLYTRRFGCELRRVAGLFQSFLQFATRDEFLSVMRFYESSS
jgi:hypothetical protein